MARRDVVRCLNPRARNSRVYWITQSGGKCQARLRKELDLPQLEYKIRELDWTLYGWVSFSHRAAVIMALDEPMQPVMIKRKARHRNSGIRMSANNVRDVIRQFLEQKLVSPVKVRKKAHLRYVLTQEGKQFRQMLLNSEWCGG